MDARLLNAMWQRIEANVERAMLGFNHSRQCRVLFADQFWQKAPVPMDLYTPCPVNCVYVNGRDNNIMKPENADGIVYHLPNFEGLLPHNKSTHNRTQKWIAMQFEPETIHTRLADPELMSNMDATATYSINSTIPLT